MAELNYVRKEQNMTSNRDDSSLVKKIMNAPHKQVKKELETDTWLSKRINDLEKRIIRIERKVGIAG